ncbi:MAG TPA: DUF559 domain-containing protein [Beijerinckiaceae bacterium]|nr:DUF559 domain-containing protein [Beijerinckiaceae bacterium]
MRDGQNFKKARALRREMTEIERKLWRLLRERRFGDIKFRRQMPVGPFIADFGCPADRIVIELDGSQQADSPSDRRRDAFLKANGWRILRFWTAT